MRRFRVCLAVSFFFVLAVPAGVSAYDEDALATTENPNRPRRPASDDPSTAENVGRGFKKLPGTMAEWGKDTGNRASIGLNGVLTAPADPVFFAMEGSEVFSTFPAAKFTGPVVGVFAGVAQMTYRVFTGVFDVTFSWVPFLYMQSPVPRVDLVPWAEHDEA